MMQPGEATDLYYLLSSSQNQYPSHFSLPNNNMPGFPFTRTPTNPLYQFQLTPNQIQDFNPQISSFSSNSTSDEADDQQLSIINERKQRRMISNRESARRSRMRKQKHLDELWSQVLWLRNENHQLIDKLNDASERHDRVLQENTQLKEEASELRQMLTNMQLNSPYHNLRDLDDDPCKDLSE
ncbi:OLC1v1009881C1 [Oldenlandia corymbosa var. corymbosa]|uniref:OLC1v1009881C1 n=1 Tax=Oldenlandia corymbosa var. corymbosa TaxID=529605 RepID=A0AAV1DQI3_OLDCO|nr:OLC1v1009881C1 [Oldenlandia corymbosa var. corymbosa]